MEYLPNFLLKKCHCSHVWKVDWNNELALGTRKIAILESNSRNLSDAKFSFIKMKRNFEVLLILTGDAELN